METLETLSKFTEKYPQKRKEKGDVNYIFIGGTAVRLNQELVLDSLKRQISDFDLLTFDSNTYPVHNFSVRTLFGGGDLKFEDIKRYISSIFLFGKEYLFADGNLITLSKTCITDPPREKDFNDIYLLRKNGLIDNKKLKYLYLKLGRITKNSSLVIDTLNWLTSDKTNGKTKLFGAFPKLVNLLADLPENSYMFCRGKLLDYASGEDKDSYQISSVVYDIHSFLREIPLAKRKSLLQPLLKKAQKNDYCDFDKIIHNEIIPLYRYSSRKNKNNLIKSLKNNS